MVKHDIQQQQKAKIENLSSDDASEGINMFVNVWLLWLSLKLH